MKLATLMTLLALLSSAKALRSSSSILRSNHQLSIMMSSSSTASNNKGKLLVLGGTGFLGQMVCQRAVVEGYSVVSLSRRGLVSPDVPSAAKADYRQGDCRRKETIATVLDEGGFTGVIHCIGLLFDDQSGLGSYNRFVSGSGSLPDSDSTYDTITRLTSFHAIEASEEYAQKNKIDAFPFCFTSAAEAGWPDVTGGALIEQNLAPDFLQRYLAAKRAVEAKLLGSTTLRPIVVRPSLIYSLDRPLSLPSVGAFYVGNKIGLPFVDRPVTVQALSAAMVRAMGQPGVSGIQRYPEIDRLSE